MKTKNVLFMWASPSYKIIGFWKFFNNLYYNTCFARYFNIRNAHNIVHSYIARRTIIEKELGQIISHQIQIQCLKTLKLALYLPIIVNSD